MGGVLGNPSECASVRSTRGPCEGGCTLNAAFALRCPSPLSSWLEVADTNLLIQHANGADLFGFHHEGGLIPLRHWDEANLRRELALDAEGSPIVVQELEGGTIGIDWDGLADGEHELSMNPLFDAAFDDGTLHVLGTMSEGLALWSLAADGTTELKTVAELDSAPALFVADSSPIKVVFGTDRLALWSFGDSAPRAFTSVPSAPARPGFVSAAELGERLIVGYRPQASESGAASGNIFVNDAGAETVVGAARTLLCPAGYIAYYPDICEFEQVAPNVVPDAVLAFDLLVHDGEPWFVTITAEVTDRCDTLSGACLETLPCDCQYLRRGSAAGGELRLFPLDEPSRVLTLELGDFPYETVSLEASSTGSGAIVVAIAEGQFVGGSHGGAAIDYLMITP
jgi:hypothetical protein